eukprot:1137828-Pelagomonas_calceolata.AAC.2
MSLICSQVSMWAPLDEPDNVPVLVASVKAKGFARRRDVSAEGMHADFKHDHAPSRAAALPDEA